jgi:LacI family transcriptional regulator
VARELGYRFRREDRSRSKTIGVILPEVSSHYYAELAHSVSTEIRKQGYNMFVALSGFASKAVDEAFEMLARQEVCGILICYIADTEAVRRDGWFSERLIKSEIPVVLLTEINSAVPLDMIYVDSSGCMQLAVDHLVSLGHEKIGYIGEYTSDSRFRAMVDYMEQKGLSVKPEFVKRGAERFEIGGYLRTKELLAEKELPTAIIACYDQVAIGVMKALNEAGLRVPEDISVIGVDNIVMNDYLPIKLTSITNPAGQIGIVAVKLLMDSLNNKEDHVVQNVALQSKLVIRDSTSVPLR